MRLDCSPTGTSAGAFDIRRNAGRPEPLMEVGLFADGDVRAGVWSLSRRVRLFTVKRWFVGAFE
jgi:hypothetical protein